MVFIPAKMTNFKLRRSALFMPSSNERALTKAPTLQCDAVIFDLEDAVGHGEKESAHANLRRLVKDVEFGDIQTVIRTGQFNSPEFSADLVIAIECSVDAVLLPKVESAEHIKHTEQQLHAAGSKSVIWAMIETPLGLMNIKEIASASLKLKCLIVGPNDLSKATGASLSNHRAALQPWLMQIVAAARAYHLNVLDGVYNNFKDHEGFGSECQQGADMGFDGKTLIHPCQIETTNRLFGPDENQLNHARAIIEAFKRKENIGKGVIQINGEMVERLHMDEAELLLAMASHTHS